MTYDLHITDQMYSSWSLRGWLMFEKFGVPVTTHMAGLYSGTMAEDLKPLAPARLVPVIRTPDGTVVGESLAIAETLAENFVAIFFHLVAALPFSINWCWVAKMWLASFSNSSCATLLSE